MDGIVHFFRLVLDGNTYWRKDVGNLITGVAYTPSDRNDRNEDHRKKKKIPQDDGTLYTILVMSTGLEISMLGLFGSFRALLALGVLPQRDR